MRIYLDHNATAPLRTEARAALIAAMDVVGNPSSVHAEGRAAKGLIETARAQVAEAVGASGADVVFTSGATEADNLAVKGAAHFHRDRGMHVVTSTIEHKAVLDSCRQLEREGFDVTYLDPTPQGLVPADSVANALRDDTVLVSIMHANNEIGTVNDISAIGEITRAAGVLFHVDAAWISSGTK